MATVAAAIGANLTIVHIPQKGPWTARSRYPAARLGAWTASHGVGFVDVLPAIERGTVRERLYYDKDGHCTAAGHAIIAGELYRDLTHRVLVP
jgi:hypothetical protein